MCGICGILRSDGSALQPEWLIRMRDVMSHRGPDDKGALLLRSRPKGESKDRIQFRTIKDLNKHNHYLLDHNIGLAHCRLSIIDLSQAGHQPMQDARRKTDIIFNGEIYNYKDLRKELRDVGYQFHSSSDTEVILAAYDQWGMDCVERFNGMFAFALYDGGHRRLFLARDRAGEKPLFYRLWGRGFEFASELKVLMEAPDFPRQLNPESLDCCLAFGYVPGERCVLKGVNKLPPGHALTFDLDTGQLHIWRYWQLPSPPQLPDEPDAADKTELVDELECLLEDSVRRQLVADVPVGILLSGGVDSSLLTAMAVRSASRVKTFTVRFPGYEKYDETEHARLISRCFGTEHLELEAEPSSVELLPILAQQFDEPIVDSSMIPTYLLSRLVRQHCTVALGGDGGDELFGGYKYYNRLLWMQKRLGHIPLSLRLSMARAAEALLPVGFKGRDFLRGLEVDLRRDLPFIPSCFDPSTRRKLMVERDNWKLVAESIGGQRIPQTGDLLQRATRMDFENYLPEDILVKVDRSNMLNSLEVRAPWLDYHIIEFAFGKVPSRLKATVSDRKILPKCLAEKLLPCDFDYQRKQGLSIPLTSWLRSQPWREYFREILLDSDGVLFNKHFVETLIDGQATGRSNSERLFALVLIELWRRQYEVTF